MPEKIGQYRIIRQVGEGGMGAVYEAEQRQPQRWVAVKIIRLDRTNEQMLRRFLRETEVLGRLEHPNVALIYQAVTGGGFALLLAVAGISLQLARARQAERLSRNRKRQAEMATLAACRASVYFRHPKECPPA